MTVDRSRWGRGVERRLATGAACFVLAVLAAAAPSRWIEPVERAAANLSVSLQDRLAPRAATFETRIALGPFGRDIRLSGEIGDGAAARLKALLDANPAVGRIHLTSEGGLVAEATALGDLIAARGLSTYVPDYCVSACTLVFVRGRERFLVADGRLGFHAPYDAGLFGQVFQAGGEAERRAYLAAGVELAFAAAALAIASGDLWVPAIPRLLEAHVVTESVETDRFPDSTLDDDPTPAGARAAILRTVTLLGGLEDVPGAVDGIAAWYLDAYRAGRSEAETLEGLKQRAADAVGRVVRQADAAVTVAVGRTLLRAMRAARAPGDPTCAAIGADGNLVLALESLQAGSDDDKREGENARALVVSAVAHRTNHAARVGRKPPPVPIEPVLDAGRACDAVIRVYAEALSKPQPTAAAALRALMSRGAAPVREASALP